jgi:competence protein ComEC
MPVASWILLAAIIGSAAGASGGWSAALLAACSCLGIAHLLRRRDRLIRVAPLLFALAAGARATADRWHAAHCRAAVVRSASVRFVTDFDLARGDAGPALLTDARGGCATPGIVRARSPLTGGRWYATTARAQPGGRALLLTVTTASRTAASSLRASLRAAGVRRVDSVFTRDAPMARALLLADMHLITPEIRDRWSRSGLVHLLSVSGVHVSIIASSLLMLARALRFSLVPATVGAVCATALYVVVLGLPPPAVRACVMFSSLLLATLRQRPASQWSVLVLGALLPVLIESAAPLDLGWQLSVLGVVALAASGHLARRVQWLSTGRGAGVKRELAASSVASLASMPLTAWYFGSVCLVAPAANLLAAPCVAVLQPTLFLALLCAPVLPVARFIAGAAHPVLAVLDTIATHASERGFAAVALAPSRTEALLGAATVAALLAAMIQRRPGLPLRCAGLSVGLLVWHPLWPDRGSGLLELHQLDVGQGDAMAIRTPRGRWVVVDAGGGAPGIDRGRRTVLPYVRRLGGTVVAFVLSHPHLDHVGGAPALIGAARPTHYFDAAFAGATGAYRNSLESAAVHGVHWQRVHPGDTLRIDDVTFRFLAPDSAWTAQLDDANLASTILRVEYGRVSALLVGDAERAEEEWLLRHTPVHWLRADILKVGHHGSRTSSGASFLDAVAPRLALVSVGRGNSYGHPSPEVLREFARRAIPVLRTDVAGTSVVRSDGSVISVTTAAARWELP